MTKSSSTPDETRFNEVVAKFRSLPTESQERVFAILQAETDE